MVTFCGVFSFGDFAVSLVVSWIEWTERCGICGDWILCENGYGILCRPSCYTFWVLFVPREVASIDILDSGIDHVAVKLTLSSMFTGAECRVTGRNCDCPAKAARCASKL